MIIILQLHTDTWLNYLLIVLEVKNWNIVYITNII